MKFSLIAGALCWTFAFLAAQVLHLGTGWIMLACLGGGFSTLLALFLTDPQAREELSR